MKIRTGFVSNSSASSFVVYGVSFSREDIPAEGMRNVMREVILRNANRGRESYLEPEDEALVRSTAPLTAEGAAAIQGLFDDGFYDDLSALSHYLGLESAFPSDYGPIVAVGLGVGAIDDDETGRQFRGRVTQRIDTLYEIAQIPKDKQDRPEVLEFSWYS